VRGATRLRRAGWARNSFISPRIVGGLKVGAGGVSDRLLPGQGATLSTTRVADPAKPLDIRNTRRWTFDYR